MGSDSFFSSHKHLALKTFISWWVKKTVLAEFHLLSEAKEMYDVLFCRHLPTPIVTIDVTKKPIADQYKRTFYSFLYLFLWLFSCDYYLLYSDDRELRWMFFRSAHRQSSWRRRPNPGSHTRIPRNSGLSSVNRLNQGIPKRCRLSVLPNSVLVYEDGGGGVTGFQPRLWVKR